MNIDIVTIFPDAIAPYFDASIMRRAQEQRRVRFGVHDLREWTTDKHRHVDDKPYGGGPGMVMQVEPFFRCLQTLRAKQPMATITRGRWKSKPKTRVLLMSAKGAPFTQRDAERYAKKYDRLVMLCGRYEGVDERVAQYLADEEVSVGPYVLTGGELPALTIADAVTRLIPGVLGKEESLAEESYTASTLHSQRSTPHSLEYPHYTRPADFSPKHGVHWRVPKALLTGNHASIEAWRKSQMHTP
ncbi:MAG: tRNA (guanosine(37)-N1)-methyltransferase TrmD [bacterium]|nr:tRNA (guanosine(37)-N1)-methyltransferase TrmD [bacterium]